MTKAITPPKKRASRFPKEAFSLRQEIAWDYYCDPKCETFDNAYRSCLKAGLTESVAKNITADKWWKEKVELLRGQLPKAERIINYILDMPFEKTMKIGDKVVKVSDEKIVRIKGEMAQFIAERVGKKRYSKKVEVEDTTPPSVEENELLKSLFT